MAQFSPKVFISYSWDDENHKTLIKNFSKKLKANNINSVIDADIPLTPKAGWIQWMKQQINESDYVILVFTQIYFDRFTKNVEPTEGLGVQWESTVIFGDIYSGKSIAKYIPVVLNDEDMNKYIPNEFACSRFNLNTGFNKLCTSINGDWESKNIIEEMRRPSYFVIEYLNTHSITKEKLIIACTKYLEKVYVDILIRYETLDDIISHISSYKQFPCIVKDLYQVYDEKLKLWLDNEDLSCCFEIESIDITPRVVIIFTSKHNAQKYNVTFISKNLPNIPDAKSDEDYDLDSIESKDQLIIRIMSYVQNANPKVDLVLPPELLPEDINLWEADFESLSRLSRLNIRDIGRYNIGDNMKELINNQWNIVLNKITNNQNLRCIEDENCIRSIGNNMIESGISSKYVLQEKHFKYLLKTEMSYIMLWVTKEHEVDLTNLSSEGVINLQNKYFSLNNSPISLMWDDPTTYYYPDEIKGESNE